MKTMRNLTKIVAPTLVASLGLALAAPASAREGSWHEPTRHGPARYASIRAEINDLSRDIDRAAARRAISRREANGLRREAADIRRLYASYARRGLSPWETQTLQRRIDRVHMALRAERRDRDSRRG
jgi:hypothetical protein